MGLIFLRHAYNRYLKEIEYVRSSYKQGKLQDKKQIESKIDKILNKYRLKCFVEVKIDENDIKVDLKDYSEAEKKSLGSVLLAIEKVRVLVRTGKYGGKDAIGVRVGKIVNRYKVSKHFILDIRDDGFEFSLDERKIAEEAKLDGVYVIRTSLPEKRLSGEETVRGYKSLSKVERAFRSMKTVDLKIRPIRHHLENRVKAHIFLCMLAYYAEWHMREVWSSLIFADEEKESGKNRDPIVMAERSDEALKKVHTKKLQNGTAVHSFQTLLKSMSQIVRNKCRLRNADSDEETFEIVTTPNEKQQLAYDLLANISL